MAILNCEKYIGKIRSIVSKNPEIAKATFEEIQIEENKSLEEYEQEYLDLKKIEDEKRQNVSNVENSKSSSGIGMELLPLLATFGGSIGVLTSTALAITPYVISKWNKRKREKELKVATTKTEEARLRKCKKENQLGNASKLDLQV